jgi:hypothetical protein
MIGVQELRFVWGFDEVLARKSEAHLIVLALAVVTSIATTSHVGRITDTRRWFSVQHVYICLQKHDKANIDRTKMSLSLPCVLLCHAHVSMVSRPFRSRSFD